MIHIFIEKFNLTHKIRLIDDARFDSVSFDSSELKTTAMLTGAQPLSKRQLKKQAWLAKSEYIQSQKEKEEAEEENKHEEASPAMTELVFCVFDSVKVKVETTTEFPLDIKCTLLFTKEDLEMYERVKHE